jgi:hypothetical protein
MDWVSQFDNNNYIAEARKLHSTYEFTLQELHQTIKVNIWESSHGEFKFMALTDHSIQTDQQAGPYRDTHPYKTPEEALQHAISGITTWLRGSYNEVQFCKEEDF